MTECVTVFLAYKICQQDRRRRDLSVNPTEKRDLEIECDRIISRMQSGDDSGFGRLCEIYRPLVESLVTTALDLCRDVGGEIDDLRQEAAIALYKAANAYDLSCSAVTFGLFAKICVKNRLISYRRRLTKSSGGRSRIHVVTGTPRSRRFSEFALPEGTIDLLSPYEQSVWRLYANGTSYTEMARQLNRNEKSVENAVYRIRAKLKGALR